MGPRDPGQPYCDSAERPVHDGCHCGSRTLIGHSRCRLWRRELAWRRSTSGRRPEPRHCARPCGCARSRPARPANTEGGRAAAGVAKTQKKSRNTAGRESPAETNRGCSPPRTPAGLRDRPPDRATAVDAGAAFVPSRRPPQGLPLRVKGARPRGVLRPAGKRTLDTEWSGYARSTG
jgi:hypothetical protein